MRFVWKNLVKISSTNFRVEHLLEELSTKLHLITKVNNIFGFEINLRSIDLKDVLLHLSYKSDKPHNPLVNSGAIMSAALILQMVKSNEFGCDMASKYELLHSYRKCYMNFRFHSCTTVHKVRTQNYWPNITQNYTNKT